LKAWTKSLITEDKSEVKNVLSEKIEIVKREVSRALNVKSKKVTDYYELLVEAKQVLGQKVVEDSVITEDFVYEVMRFCDLVEDLKE
jgi:hypothetical protein